MTIPYFWPQAESTGDVDFVVVIVSGDVRDPTPQVPRIRQAVRGLPALPLPANGATTTIRVNVTI